MIEDEELTLLKRRRKRRARFMTGEDIDMLNERKQEEGSNKSPNICDTHVDGA
ncbi:MAG: hypothetical protein K6F07_03915 [Bacilli bacterium]|nr:hypothetical protein [Bacilli bacterium]